LFGYIETGFFAFLSGSIGYGIHVDYDLAILLQIQRFT